MIAFNFIVCVLVAVSVAFILTSEYIFKWFRDLIIRTEKETLITFIHCPVCVSWWSGLVVGLLAVGCSWWVFAVAFSGALLARIIRMFEE